MNPEQRIKMLIGELMFNHQIALARIEELEKQLAPKDTVTNGE